MVRIPATTSGGYGGVVMIEHVINGETYTALYAHLIDIPAEVWTAFHNGTTLPAQTHLGGMGNGTFSSVYSQATPHAFDFDQDGTDEYYALSGAHLHFSIALGSHDTPSGDWRAGTLGDPTPEGVATMNVVWNGQTTTFYDPWAFIENPPAGDSSSDGGGGDSAPDFTQNRDVVLWDSSTIAFAGGGDDYVRGTGRGDIFYGQGGNDTLTGYAGDDDLFGGGGHDQLRGGTGVDNLVGGYGDDTYFVDNVGDSVLEYALGGQDHVNASVTYSLSAQGQHIENLTLTGAGNISGTGNGRTNVINGNSGNNTLNGAWGSYAQKLVTA